MNRLRDILGLVLVAYTPLSPGAMDELLGRKESFRITSALGALISGTTSSEEVEMLHTSFRDYLTDKESSKEFFINAKEHHIKMAGYCLRVLNDELKFNICGFKDPHVLYEDMNTDDLEARRDGRVSKALLYASRYWIPHVLQMDQGNYNLIKGALYQFLLQDKHLMQWIEILSVTKAVDAVLSLMDDLLTWFKVSNIVCVKV